MVIKNKLVLWLPFFRVFAFSNERIIAALLAVVITAMAGIAAGRSDS